MELRAKYSEKAVVNVLELNILKDGVIVTKRP